MTLQNIGVGIVSLLIVRWLWRLIGAYRTRRAAAMLAKGELSRRGARLPSTAAVANAAAAALRIQSRITAGRLFIWNGTSHLLRAADDNWSIGYLNGFALQALWRAGAAASEAEKGVDAVFRGVFGKERAEALLVRLTNLEFAQDSDYDVGYQSGMADCAAWMSSRGTSWPRGWAEHIADFERGAEPLRI